MTNNYESLVNDVAGALVDGCVHLDTALYEAQRYCYDFYGAQYEDLLNLAGKTEADLKRDAILRARAWNIEYRRESESVHV